MNKGDRRALLICAPSLREVGSGRDQLRQAPTPTYKKGKAVSLFSGNVIPAEYIKAKAQAGDMDSRLYVVAVKTPQGLEFQPPLESDLQAIEAAAKELAKHRARWEKDNVIPTERIPVGDKTGEPLARGIKTWADVLKRDRVNFGVTGVGTASYIDSKILGELFGVVRASFTGGRLAFGSL